MSDDLATALRCTLSSSDTNAAQQPPVVALPGLQEALASEGAAPHITAGNVDRALMARLVEEPPAAYPLPPVPYLLGCYQRLAELATAKPEQKDTIADVQEAVLNHVWLCVNESGVVPQPPHIEAAPGWRQLWDALWHAVPHSPALPRAPHVVPLPHGFLEASRRAFPSEVAEVVTHMLRSLQTLALRTSILGDVAALDACWLRLMESKELAAVVAASPLFVPVIPETSTAPGRQFQENSALACLMAISMLPDSGERDEPTPSVRREVWESGNAGADLPPARRAAATAPAEAHVAALQHMFSPKGLLCKEARAATLAWLRCAVACDAERRKEYTDARRALSDGFMVNLTRVLLHLCAPFLVFSSGKAAQFVDPRYVASAPRIDYASMPRFGADDDAAVRAWRSEHAAAGDFHFITECFFITAQAVDLTVPSLMQRLQDAQEEESLRGASAASRGDLLAVGATLDTEPLKVALMKWAQLVCAWLLHTRFAAAGTGMPPCTSSPPPPFLALPEHLALRAADILRTLYSLNALSTADSGRVEGVACCFVTLLGDKEAMANPYSRFLLARPLYELLPESSITRQLTRVRGGRPPGLDSVLTQHPAIQKQLVPGLMALYVDARELEALQQFQEKVDVRYTVVRFLQALWKHRAHVETWREATAAPAHQPFLNALLDDCTDMLNMAITEMQQLKASEGRPADPLSAAQLQAAQARVSFGLSVADSVIALLIPTSAAFPAAFLSPAIVGRLTSMLNYFLRHLTGPDRAKLKIADMSRVNFDPKKLLASILQIYLNAHDADRAGAFAAAVAADGRSYRPENFSEALRIATELGLPGFSANHCSKLKALAAAVQREKADEELTAEAPDEFLDPIEFTIMRDPVILPGSNIRMDRACILRSILQDGRDPITRLPLAAEDLKPDDELRGRVRAWLAERRRSK